MISFIFRVYTPCFPVSQVFEIPAESYDSACSLLKHHLSDDLGYFDYDFYAVEKKANKNGGFFYE
ncbi:MAG: hypothetical protein HDR35_04735 [Treponema sp.]|nr:hypothetical protein [Treponema sp.]